MYHYPVPGSAADTAAATKGILMSGIINTIVSLLVAVFVTGGVSNIAQETPREAVNEFFTGLTEGDPQVYELYMDNSYINLLANSGMSDEDASRMHSALFEDFQWEITDSAERENIQNNKQLVAQCQASLSAVDTSSLCKVTLTNSDFRPVLESYEKDSHDYVMDNLYEDKVTDKDQLAAACLDIYLDCLEAAADKDESVESEIFIPLESDGFSGWRVIPDDTIMKAAAGGLVLPAEK